MTKFERGLLVFCSIGFLAYEIVAFLTTPGFMLLFGFIFTMFNLCIWCAVAGGAAIIEDILSHSASPKRDAAAIFTFLWCFTFLVWAETKPGYVAARQFIFAPLLALAFATTAWFAYRSVKNRSRTVQKARAGAA